VKFIYQPSKVQQEFHLCQCREALFAGSAGPGKTEALLMDPIQTQLIVEDARLRNRDITKSAGWAIHFRREMPMLRQTIERALRRYPLVDQGVQYDTESHTFTFSCGYRIQFAHMANPGDYRIYDSSEYSAIYFDEVIQFTEEQYNYLESRCRSSDPVLRTLLRVRCATNPAAGWVKRYFVDPAPEGRTILRRTIRLEDGTEEHRDRVFIPALLRDNPDEGFRRDYEVTLRKLPPHIRLARLNGRWDVVQGAFFETTFLPEVHVIKEFPIPSGWTKWRVMDWGYKTRCVVTWWAKDPDDNIVCYREAAFRLKDDDYVAKAIRDIERHAGEWNRVRDCSALSGPADWQIWDQRGTQGPTIAERMASHGVFWERCTKDRHAATAELLRRLCAIPCKANKREFPSIAWFDCCKESIRTIPMVETDPDDSEVPLKGGAGGEDHCLDNAFYSVMYRAALPKYDIAPKNRYDEDELEDRRRKVRKIENYGFNF
jgi:hypothetical protein